MSDMQESVDQLGKIGKLTLESYEIRIDGATMVWRCELEVDTYSPRGFTVEVFDQSPLEALRKVQEHVALAARRP